MKFKALPLIHLLSCVIALASFNTGSISAQVSGWTSRMTAAFVPQDNDPYKTLEWGRVLLKRGKADLALERLQSALYSFKQAGDRMGVAASNDALGDLYFQQGQYAVALKFYQEAHDVFRAASSSQGAVAATDEMPDKEFNANLMLAKIGDTYYRMGKTLEASAAYAAMRVEKPDPSKLVGGGQKRGGGFGGLSGAIPGTGAASGIAGAINRDNRILARLYHQNSIYLTHEVDLGRIEYFNRSFDNSRRHYMEALAAATTLVTGRFGQSRRARAVARTSLGDIALQENRLTDAMKFYSDAVRGARDDKRPDLMWPAQRGFGKVRWLQATQEKDPKKGLEGREEAIASYREALQTIEAIRAGSLRADEARTSFLVAVKNVYDEASSNLAEMAFLSAPAPDAPLRGRALAYAAEAFKIVEQGRARSLLDMLGEAGADITEGVPPDLLKLKQDNLARQQAIAQHLTGV